jgi:hypothetical protein
MRGIDLGRSENAPSPPKLIAMTTGTIRRRLRISLRATMLAIVVLGLWLGWQVNRARRQREAVAAIQRYGGWVHYDYEFVNGTLTPGRSPRAPGWLRRLLGDEFFQEVRQVSLVYDDSTGKRFDNRNVRACDEILALASRLPGLEILLLKETQATDKGLRHIGKMTGLEELFIWDATSVTDAGVGHLRSLQNLKKVHISKSKLTDRGLALLGGLPSIRELSLQQNHFSDDGLARLGGRDRLKRLYLGLGDGQITGAGLAYLRSFRGLEILDVQGTEANAGDAEGLVECLPKLKELWLNGRHITSADKQGLGQLRPGLMVR